MQYVIIQRRACSSSADGETGGISASLPFRWRGRVEAGAGRRTRSRLGGYDRRPCKSSVVSPLPQPRQYTGRAHTASSIDLPVQNGNSRPLHLSRPAVTGHIPATPYYSLSPAVFLGRPGLPGRNGLPRIDSRRITKPSLPAGRPVRSCRRRRAIVSSGVSSQDTPSGPDRKKTYTVSPAFSDTQGGACHAHPPEKLSPCDSCRLILAHRLSTPLIHSV